MADYIDGFVFPIPTTHLEEYKAVAEDIAEIWKEHGAISYHENICDDLHLEGTISFVDLLDVKDTETIIFGWITFESKEHRDIANKKVASDPRMVDLIGPLVNPENVIFNAKRMTYGGFQSFISKM